MKEFDTFEFEQLCRQERKRIRTLELNDQYRQTVIYNDRTYTYDPDYDCFYPTYTWEELSYWDRYGRIWVTVALGVLAYCVSP